MLVGRNEKCHCGSDKKYKKCCLQKDSVKSSRVSASKNVNTSYDSIVGASKNVNTSHDLLVDPNQIVYTSHDLINGIKELALAQLEQVIGYLNKRNKYDQQIKFNFMDLMQLADLNNMESHFIQVVRESFEAKNVPRIQIMMELDNYKKIAKDKPKLSEAECQLIKVVARTNLSEYMQLTDVMTADYGAMRAITQFGYSVLKEGIPKDAYIESAKLYVDTDDKLVSWDLELSDNLVEDIWLDLISLDELYNEYEKYAHVLHGLEQESKSSLATVLLREATSSNKSRDKLSYIGLAIHYIGIFEQELRLLIASNEKWENPRKIMWNEICTYLESNTIPYLTENIVDIAKQLKILHPIRNRVAHGEAITEEEFKMFKSLAIDKQAFEFISWAKIYYEEN